MTIVEIKNQGDLSEQIHEFLRFLAGQCDFARDRDGMGFNRIDAYIGHSLAQQVNLSPAQVRVGAKLARKYRKQLEAANYTLPDFSQVEEYIASLPVPIAIVPLSTKEATPIQQQNKIYIKNKRIYVEFLFDPAKIAAIQPLKKLPGWRYNKEFRKEWSFPIEHVTEVLDAFRPFDDFTYGDEIAEEVAQTHKLAEIAAQQAELEAQAEEETRKAALENARPYLDGQALPGGRYLFTHQKEAVRQLIGGKRMVLAHDMGLGKTASALVAAKAYNCTTIVICPASLKINWLREAEQVGLPIEVWSWAKLPEPPETNFILIADEAHYAQNLRSQRTQGFLALADEARAVFCLTGTPIKNGRPVNLFPLLQACQHPLANNKKEYEQHYCAAHVRRVGYKEIYDVTGAAHLDELYKKTAGVCILYKKKEECLKDLPKKIRVFREAEVSTKAHKAYLATIEALRAASEARIKATKSEQEAMIAEKTALGEDIDEDELKDPDQARAIVELGILRHAGSLAKVENAIEIAQEVLEQQESVVLFTAYRDTAQQLSEALHCECLSGDTTTEQRQAMIDRFQVKDTRAIVCMIGAGGVGITLTAAQTVIMVDRPWTPGDAMQAEDRCHRIGQIGTVTAIWLQYEQIDEMIDQLLIQKQERIELVLSGKRKTLRGIKSIQKLAKDILKAIKKGKMLDSTLIEEEETIPETAYTPTPIAPTPIIVESTLVPQEDIEEIIPESIATMPVIEADPIEEHIVYTKSTEKQRNPKGAGRKSTGLVRVDIKITPEQKELTKDIDRSEFIRKLLDAHFGIQE